jgi:hypothetical protein
MTWRHAVAAVVEDATDEQGFGPRPFSRVAVSMLIELGLNRLE